MATERKVPRQATKRSVSGSLIQTEGDNIQSLQNTGDLADDHEFLVPNELYVNAIGLLFCLITKRLISTSFTNIYHRSQRVGWMDLLNRERRNLKSNINSVEKCFMLNRLIAECAKDPNDFTQQTTNLYKEIKMRMSSTVTSSSSTAESSYNEVQAWRNLQCHRRLFHISHNELNQPQTLLGLQRTMSKLCSELINSSQTNTNYFHQEGRNQLTELLQHSFIIVAQPSTPECVSATKYEKFSKTYTAKLHSRILCLLDIDKIQAHFTFASINVTLYSLNREVCEEGEIQPALEWKIRTIVDAKGHSKVFLYAEVQSIRLTKLDPRSSRPLYSSKLCQLQFQMKIRINNLNIEEDVTFLSRPFGLCSHAQYFPEYVAKTLIYEIEQIPQTAGPIIQPNILTNFISSYHTRIAGVEPKAHTRQFILEELRTVYEAKKSNVNMTSIDIYQEILAKLISQIEFFLDHPFLSMMYHDSLFLGICNSEIDNDMNGTQEELQILLRFNMLGRHQSTQQPSVRYIVHNGQLIKATVHTKAFVDEMCRLICESNSEKTKTSRIISDIPNLSFHDFSLYFDNELYRLGTIASPTKEAYKPLIPVLWSTMRTNTDDPCRQVGLSNTTKSSLISSEKMSAQTDTLIHYIAGKLSGLLIKFQTENPSSSSDKTSIPTDEILKKEKLLLSSLLHDYLQTKGQIRASTQALDEMCDSKSYACFCAISSSI